jgi:membrane protease YdiL (CAAX protease family)
MPITPPVILRAVLLNGIGGVVFGWLFFKKGLEFAMISHFSLDIVLHVFLPLLGYSLL